MKTKISIVILIISICSACEANVDSAFNIKKSDLVGSWALTSFEMDDAILIITNPGPEQTIIADVVGNNYNAFISLTENPDIANVSGDFTLVISYNQTNVDLYIVDAFVFNDVFGFSSSSWGFNNNVLSLNEGGTNLNLDIIDFTNNILKVEVDFDQTVAINGISSNVTGKAILTLEK